MFENLKALRKEHGFSQEAFAKSLGIPTNTYANYEKGVREPGSDFWISVAEKYNVSIDYLLGFTDDPQRSKFATPSKLDQKYAALDEHGRKMVDAVITLEAERIAAEPQATEKIVDLGVIRHYFSRIAAGVSGFTEDDYEDIPRTPDMPKNADFCLTVSGDSMEPYIHDGEMIFVTETLPVENYDVGAFSVNGESYVKQYLRRPDGSVDLLSANPERVDFNVHIEADSDNTFRCWGRVILPRKLPVPVYN